MKSFNLYKREHNLHRSILQLKTLLGSAIENQSSTYISYAALEGRMSIERVEFEILAMADNEMSNFDFQDIIKQQNGIHLVNSKLKALRFRYQTFTEASKCRESYKGIQYPMCIQCLPEEKRKAALEKIEFGKKWRATHERFGID